MISGHFEFDPQVRALLLNSLPDMIKARARTSANRSLVLALPALMASEMRDRRPGGAVIVERLAEILLVQVLRDHFEQLRTCVHAERPSLMAALFDPRLGAALHFMYAESAKALTLAAIAAAAGMSRSAFALHFKQLTGEMPMAHLAEWRLLRATQLLVDGTLSIAQVATACGHQSAEGFSRAFKRRHGASPAQWRQLNTSRRTAPGDARAVDGTSASVRAQSGPKGSKLNAQALKPSSIRALLVSTEPPGVRKSKRECFFSESLTRGTDACPLRGSDCVHAFAATRPSAAGIDPRPRAAHGQYDPGMVARKSPSSESKVK